MRLWSDGELDDDSDISSWMAKRAGDVARLNDPQSEAAGRDAWAAATQRGADLSAPTPLDVRALGAAQLACGSPPSSSLDELVERARAVGRGATDGVLFGYGDQAEAAIGSVPALFTGQPVGSRFHQLVQAARDQDQYDQIHYPLSRGLGEAGGTALDILATDGAAATIAPRLATTAVRAMPALSNATRARVALGGAALGVVGQGATDVLSHHPSGWRDYVGAAAGGGAMAASGGRLRPVPTAALGAGVTSTLDGLLNRDFDSENVGHSMVAGGGFGGVGQLAGEYWSNGLRPWQKGKLGEALSDAKSFFEGNPTAERQVPRSLSGGGRTILDSTLVDGPVEATESKFGPWARPTPNQLRYQAQNPGTVRNDHWMPPHVGQIAGQGLSALGLPAVDWADPNRRAPWQ
ncbi:hypothetical protein [Phenylobacterium sp.]|uniref:hypothetical protein n=1 Tax=Phenylobacterium sp. TaxID=1871053 RepID=UPI002CAB0CCB|nr:hypothetical protein [Phenylobacterium sp.]HLZ73986.1 hypothetical protein [Phenylobacterium sp.]